MGVVAGQVSNLTQGVLPQLMQGGEMGLQFTVTSITVGSPVMLSVTATIVALPAFSLIKLLPNQGP
jgi:uncharacterized membrane protein YdcZ (DUF606 family)